MIRLEGNALTGQQGAAMAQAEDLASQTGLWRGEQVQVKDSASELADAAEEISLYHAEKAESKLFEERDCQSGARSEAIAHIEQIMGYLEAANAYEDSQKLVDLVKRMQASQSHPRELARQQGRDPAHQYALLQYALHEGEKSGAPAQALDNLRDAIADLEMEAGPQIRAGLASIGSAAEFARSSEEMAAFQATYQDVVLGNGLLSQTLHLAIERLGGAEGEDLARGLKGLVRALGADLSAARPSIEPTRLQALVQDLYQLEVAATVLDNCRGLADTLQNKHGTAGLRPVALMKELVAVTSEKWVAATRFTSLADRLGVLLPGAQIAFQTSVKFMLRDMPVQVFPDMDSRQSVLNASQEALDIAIDREEE